MKLTDAPILAAEESARDTCALYRLTPVIGRVGI